MPQDLKQKAAEAALSLIQENDLILGIGTGSTVDYLIDALPRIKSRIEACVASSEATEQRLKARGLPTISFNAAPEISLYIDGADEVTKRRELIKGRGGALTREKILATAAAQFICIVDQSKCVDRLGKAPIPIEILPMARSFVARELVKMGGDPAYRQGFVTDNGNLILDVYNLDLLHPIALEESIKLLPGVIDCGLFVKRLADKVIIATDTGIDTWS